MADLVAMYIVDQPKLHRPINLEDLWVGKHLFTILNYQKVTGLQLKVKHTKTCTVHKSIYRTVQSRK